MGLKEFIYKLDSYSFAQWKFLRKWYGGEWTKVTLLLRDNVSTIDVWTKGKPDFKHEKIVKVENW